MRILVIGEDFQRLEVLEASLMLCEAYTAGHILLYDEIAVDTIKRQLTLGGRVLRVTPIQTKILAALMQHPEESITRKQLFDAVYGRGFSVTDRMIDAHIFRLRHRIGPPYCYWLRTEHRRGYRLLKI